MTWTLTIYTPIGHGRRTPTVLGLYPTWDQAREAAPEKPSGDARLQIRSEKVTATYEPHMTLDWNPTAVVYR